MAQSLSGSLRGPESKLPHSGKYTLPSEIADAKGEQILCFTPQGERGLGTPMFSADLAQRTVGFERIRATLAAVEPPAERRIALIGSSHGAFSTGQLLYDRLRPEFPDLQLDICARSAVRVFRSPQEAENYDLQEFDSVVRPQTSRLHLLALSSLQRFQHLMLLWTGPGQRCGEPLQWDPLAGARLLLGRGERRGGRLLSPILHA